MNVEFINPFIESSDKIIKEVTGLSPNLGKLYVKQTDYTTQDVIVLIGLTGEIHGSVVINLSKVLACNIASAMMMGMPVPELDEIAKSAISELCNMILGNAATLFSRKGIVIDITPPTILIGNDIHLSMHKSLIVCIPFLFEDGTRMEIDISYLDK